MVEPAELCHVVAMPYPGRGHVNPMMNLCKLLVSRRDDILITFVVTEEWLDFIGSESKPDSIRFATMPNVIPSELGRAADFPGFVEAVSTKLEAPFERVLDQLGAPVSVILADTYVVWAVGVGNRRNIPVASLWPMPATVFSVFYHFDLLPQNGHFPIEVSERGEELVDYIPGNSPSRIADLPTIFGKNITAVLNRALEAVSKVSKAQYLLFTSIDEIEAQVINTLSTKFPFPLYPTGAAVPSFKLEHISFKNDLGYSHWLDSQPTNSVLYVSMGSFLSVSSAQMDEIAAGLCDSGVRYLWVARGETSRFQKSCGDMGLVVSWCDQLKVLCHSSVGGFWTHCGWNSTLESVCAGVPMLTFPIFWDQLPNSKLIVEDWKVGWRVKKEGGVEKLVKREEIAELVRRFMDLESDKGKEMRGRVREVQEISRRAIGKSGSCITNLDAFIRDISH